MSADTRSVSTDALETLGTILTSEQKRDAIHLAVIPVIAEEYMKPGDPISQVAGKAFIDINGLGIVDPFILRPVEKDEQFWMVIKPRLITSLRHVWSHPAFDDEPEIDLGPTKARDQLVKDRLLNDEPEAA